MAAISKKSLKPITTINLLSVKIVKIVHQSIIIRIWFHRDLYLCVSAYIYKRTTRPGSNQIKFNLTIMVQCPSSESRAPTLKILRLLSVA